MDINVSAFSAEIMHLGGVAITTGMLFALLVIAGALLLVSRHMRASGSDAGRLDELLEAQAEMQSRLAYMTETVSARHTELGQALHQRMDNMGQRIGQTLGEQTRSTHENLRNLQERLAVIDAAQNNIRTLAKDVVGLQAILSNKQTRGAFGQGRMETIIGDALPSGSYSFQPVLSNGLRPDCTINMPNGMPPLVIDAKFPLEAWNAIRADSAPEARKLAGRQFHRDMEVHIRDVAGKYLIPGETQDTAFLFVPSESIFADIHQHFESLVQKAQRARIVIVSPSLLMLSVQLIQTLLRDQRMREEAHVIRSEVAMLLEDIERLDERTRKLQGHFAAAQKDVDMILTSSGKLTRRGMRITGMDPDPATPQEVAPRPEDTGNEHTRLRFRMVDER